MPRILLLLSFLCCCADAQFVGRVVDAETGQGLPFATVKTLPDEEGTQTDVDGMFHLNVVGRADMLVITYIGYHSDTIPVTPDSILVALKPDQLKTEVIVVHPSVNPALRIIQLAIDNRKKHHPQLLPAFNYNSYTKIRLVPSKGMKMNEKGDSLMQIMDLLLWEIGTRRHFIFPNKDYERITGSKLSGLQDKALPISPTEFQDVSFYTDWVSIFEQPFLSPLAFSALNRYNYQLSDTLYDYRDSVFVIQFEPKHSFGKGLQGTLHIHSDGYAISYISAVGELSEDVPSLLRFRIQQQHRQVGTTWFPAQFYTEADFALIKQRAKADDYFILKAKTWLDSINFIPNRDIAFDEIALEVTEGAGRRDDRYWEQQRQEQLASRDSTTYEVIDSLASKTPISWIFGQINKIRLGYIGVGPLDIDLQRLYSINKIEGNRFGIGILTNEKISKYFSIGGWTGYGTKDIAWKYGGMFYLHPFKDPRYRLHYEYDKDLVVTGSNYTGLRNRYLLHERSGTYRSSRMFFMEIMDYVERNTVSLFTMSLSNIQHRFSLRTEQLHTAYPYAYKQEAGFQFTELETEVRWASKERFRKEGRQLISIGTKMPILVGRFTKGLDGALDGGYDYTKVEVSLGQSTPLRGWLSLSYQLNVGIMEGELPYPKLHIFHANGEPNFIAEGYTFNTMFFNDFTASRYGTAFIHLHFVNSRFPGRRYNPDFRLVFNGAWGDLEGVNQAAHGELALQAPSLGFYESGFALINLLPRPLLKLAPSLQFMGFGLYVRYGPYAREKFSENLAPKMEYRIKF